MRKAVRTSLASLVLMAPLALPAYASASTWTETAHPGTIYLDGFYTTEFFHPPVTTPSTTTSITSVGYNWMRFTNGNAADDVVMCYQQRFSSTDHRCTGILATQTGATSLFNGLSAKGSFTLRHTLTGGTYPAFGTSLTDTVTVNYTP
jgi:Flagellar protein FlhE